MRLSIIVPFWGVEKYFEELLESLESQEMKDIEFLLIDDCSPDRSRDIALKFQSKDERFIIVSHEKNKGQGGARNTGLLMARGEYVWFVDSDDVIRSREAASELVSEMDRGQLDVLQFSSWRLSEEQPKENFRYEPFPEKFTLTSNIEIVDLLIHAPFRLYVVWDKIFRKDFLITNECYALENTASQDGICMVWILNAQRFGYLNRTYYYYRIRENSVSTSRKDASSYDHLLRVANQIEAYYEKHMKDDCNKRVFVAIRLLDAMITSKAPKACYRMSSKKDKKEILDKFTNYFENSKFFNEKFDDESLDFIFQSFKTRHQKLEKLKRYLQIKDKGYLTKNLKSIFDYDISIISRAAHRLQMALRGDIKSVKVVVRYMTPYLVILVWRKILEKKNRSKNFV